MRHIVLFSFDASMLCQYMLHQTPRTGKLEVLNTFRSPERKLHSNIPELNGTQWADMLRFRQRAMSVKSGKVKKKVKERRCSANLGPSLNPKGGRRVIFWKMWHPQIHYADVVYVLYFSMCLCVDNVVQIPQSFSKNIFR